MPNAEPARHDAVHDFDRVAALEREIAELRQQLTVLSSQDSQQLLPSSGKDELFDSEARYRALIELSPQVVWMTDAKGNPTYANRYWHEFSGLTASETSGTRWTSALHPEDVEKTFRAWMKAVEQGVPHEIEARIRRQSDGQYRWHLIRAVPVRDANQNVVKWFGSGTDIEKQKRSQQTLEEQVHEHTTALVAANARLKQEMEDKEAAQTELNRQSERVVRELTESSKKASQLRQMGELMQSCTNMEEAVSIVLGFAPKIFQQLRGALILLTPSKTHLKVAGSWSNCELPNSSYDANACWAIRTGHLHAVDAGDPSAPRAHAKGMKNAYFCVPILAQGETIGIIHFQATGAPTRVGLNINLRLPAPSPNRWGCRSRTFDCASCSRTNPSKTL